MISTLLTTFVLSIVVAKTSLAEPLPALRITMISLPVAEPTRSLQFYGDTLGLQLIGKAGEVTLFRAGDVTLVLNHPAATGAKVLAGAMEVIFPVGSVAEGYAKLAARGCTFATAPHEVTTGTWAATFRDPDGHLLTILGPK